jgi:hypothetical protein
METYILPREGKLRLEIRKLQQVPQQLRRCRCLHESSERKITEKDWAWADSSSRAHVEVLLG